MFSTPNLLKIDGTRWTSNVRTPMVLIDWIFLVQVNFEELVIHSALEVLVPNWNVTFLKACQGRQDVYSRVDFREIRLDQVVLADFVEFLVFSLDWFKVSFALEGSIVDLAN